MSSYHALYVKFGCLAFNISVLFMQMKWAWSLYLWEELDTGCVVIKHGAHLTFQNKKINQLLVDTYEFVPAHSVDKIVLYKIHEWRF